MEDFKAAEMTRLNNLDFRQKILTVIASVKYTILLCNILMGWILFDCSETKHCVQNPDIRIAFYRKICQ